MTREQHEQLAKACDYLEHYHVHHTEDKITRFKGKTKFNKACDIIVVSDPEWRQKLRDFVSSEFPDGK